MATKERLLSALRTQAALYRDLTLKIKALEAKRAPISTFCKEAMIRLGLDALRFEDGKMMLKALKYEIVKTEWSVEDLLALAEKRDVSLTRIVPDEVAIEKAAEEGKVSIEELHACGGVRKSYGFRVDKYAEEKA